MGTYYGDRLIIMGKYYGDRLLIMGHMLVHIMVIGCSVFGIYCSRNLLVNHVNIRTCGLSVQTL